MNKKELLKNIGDPIWRLHNLYRIVDKNSNKVVFKPNVPQQRLFKNKSKRKAILKARQHGITTGCLVEMFDYTIFNENVTSCILAHKEDTIKKIFNIPRKLYRFMHPEIRPQIALGGGSRYEMYFPEINSRIYCGLESRGDTNTRLHISEAAFADPERVAATMQTVPIHGWITMETTPNGFGNHFYEFWVGTQTYEKIFLPWFINPEYCIPHRGASLVLSQEEKDLIISAKRDYGVDITQGQILYRRMKVDEPGGLFIQEYPENEVDCFLFSGTPAMKAHIVKELLDTAPDPISLHGPGEAQIFHTRDAKKTYVCGVDTASGVGLDSCVAVIFDRETMEEQACLAGKWPPFEFANLINDLCHQYAKGPAFPHLVVESNNHGNAVLLQLIHHCRYPNLYYHNNDTTRPGWLTDMISRPLMINTFIDAVHNDHALINSKETLRECLALVDNKGKIEATEGFHDDRVVACAIAITVISRTKPEVDLYKNLGRAIRL